MMQNDDKSTQTSGQENVGAMLMQFLKLQQERDIAFSAKLDDLVQRLEAIALQSEHNCGSAVHCEFDKSPPTQSNNPDGTNFNTKTPISINLPLKTIKFNATFYRRLAREWNSKRVTMEELFKYMGNGLSAAYDAISAKACADIAARTHDFCVRNGLGRLETEDQRQTATNHLFQLIEKHLVPLRADSLPKLYWEDRHVTPMQNLRKPDGILLAGVRGLETRWSSVVAPIELKSSAYGHEDNHLRGQLIQDFRDMSEHQPRRFILGLAGAGQEMCEVRVYLHMSLGLFYRDFNNNNNNGGGGGGFPMPQSFGGDEDGTRGYDGGGQEYGLPNPDDFSAPRSGGPGGPGGYGPPQGYNSGPQQGYNSRLSQDYNSRPPQNFGGGYGQPSPNYNRPPPQQQQQQGSGGGYGQPPQQRPQQQRPQQGSGGGYGQPPQQQQQQQRPQQGSGGGYGQPPSNRPPPKQQFSDGPAPSNYTGSSTSLPGKVNYQDPPNKKQSHGQGQGQGQKPPRPQQSGPAAGDSPFGGLDLAALAPMAMGLFGGSGGGKGSGKGGSGGGAGGLGALAALAPMAMGLLSGGGGGKSGGGGAGGLGPLMGIAQSFLGGGSGGGSGGGKKPKAGGDFFSSILGKVFGSGTRDLDNGSMEGLGRRDAERFHHEIYMQSQSISHYTDEQLGAAAAVQAIDQMQKSGSLDSTEGHEDASQKMLGAVMSESVLLHERHEREGGSADKEATAVAAVRTALKIIDDAAATKDGRYASPGPSGLQRDNSFGSQPSGIHRDNSFGSQQYSNNSYNAPYNGAQGGFSNEYQGGGFQNEYQGGGFPNENLGGGFPGAGYNSYQGGYQNNNQGGGFPGGGYNNY
ncbi:hypothetical protein GGF43_000830 [Coemansia sp. RSA 2618]|nr:hypothetical protein GGF43_000830 [Coemansia sp. RSA 2618]